MSDIPDWLVELAAQQGQEDETEEVEEAEWDFLRAEPAEDPGAAPAPVTNAYSAPPAVPAAGEDVAEGDVMTALRSQVDLSEPEEMPEAAQRKSLLDFRVAGLHPWQQMVLAVLVFLDVAVIGLLFLVMLGRVGIP